MAIAIDSLIFHGFYLLDEHNVNINNKTTYFFNF